MRSIQQPWGVPVGHSQAFCSACFYTVLHLHQWNDLFCCKSHPSACFVGKQSGRAGVCVCWGGVAFLCRSGKCVTNGCVALKSPAAKTPSKEHTLSLFRAWIKMKMILLFFLINNKNFQLIHIWKYAQMLATLNILLLAQEYSIEHVYKAWVDTLRVGTLQNTMWCVFKQAGAFPVEQPLYMAQRSKYVTWPNGLRDWEVYVLMRKWKHLRNKALMFIWK